MDWWRFLAWNAAGALVWATGVSVIAYRLGEVAGDAIGRYGLFAGGGALVLTLLGFLVVRRVERRVLGPELEEVDGEGDGGGADEQRAGGEPGRRQQDPP